VVVGSLTSDHVVLGSDVVDHVLLGSLTSFHSNESPFEYVIDKSNVIDSGYLVLFM
jgi:hypothetical protein